MEFTKVSIDKKTNNFSLLNFLAFCYILSIFLDGFTLRFEFLPFDLRPVYIVSAAFIFFSPLYFSKLKIKTIYLILIIIFVLIECYFFLFTKISMIGMLFKQLVAIFPVFISAYLIVRLLGINKILKYYLNVAVFMSSLNIIQQFSYLVNVGTIYNFEGLLPNWRLSISANLYRAHALFSEPSHYALALVPAFFMAAYSIIDRKRKIVPLYYSVIIVLGYIFTFSGVAFLGIFFSFLLISIDNLRFKSIVYRVLIGFIIILILYNLPSIKKRVLQSLQVIFKVSSTEKVNLSTLTLLNNVYITLKSFKDHPILGYGLGTYEKVYEKYSKTLTIPITELNKKDANSLFLRITAELGIMGIIIVLIFIFRTLKPKKKFLNIKSYLINRASMVYILLRFIRAGNYANIGLWLFIVLMYYSASLNYRRRKYEDNAQ